jgi:DNA polymerase IV
MKFNDFEVITRSRSVPLVLSNRDDLEGLSMALLRNAMPVCKPDRLLGGSLSSLQGADQELPHLDLLI